MKKTIVAMLVGAAVSANAGLVTWTGGSFGADPQAVDFSAGNLVLMFQDVGNDNAAGWQNDGTFTLNLAGDAVGSGSMGQINDVYLGFSTTILNPTGTVKLFAAKAGLAVPDSIKIYSIIFNAAAVADATIGYVHDASTFDSGTVVAPGTPLSYNATTGGQIFGTQNVVIPEPATFGMMAVAGLGLFLARKKTRS
jgi:hypothetical protein